MDDYIHSLPSIEEAIDTINQTKDSLHKGGFRLTKFVSNKHEALRFIEQEDRDELKEINRVLGQKWNTKTDCFLMKTLEHFPRIAIEYTQRKMFSLVSTIFDPLGILSPLTIRIKMLLQQVWKLGKKWDEPLPVDLHSNLQKVLDSYFAMPDIEIPRWLNSLTNQENNHQLHVFVDASTVALSAVAYIRTQKQDEIFQTSFLLGKCKVAPIKQISVPKLELEAAVLGTRLRTLIETEMTLKFEKVYLWTDSRVVLDCISSTKKQNVFVSNRLEEIKRTTKTDEWNHVPTKFNPADHGTRGLEPSEIPPKWLTAPQFLQNNESSWKDLKKISTVGAVTRNTKTPIKPVLDPNRFSTWNKLLLTLATVFNLIYRAKKNRSDKSQYTKDDVCLSQSFLLKLSQNNAFSSTINALKRTQKLDAKSKLRNLNPIIDQNGLLRSSGRLLFAPTELEIEKCPIILDAKEKIARLYLEHAHRICAHQATEPVKAFVQQRYYVIGLRKTLLPIKYRCFLCRRFDTQNIQPIMAPLPAFRFPTEETKFPFANTGLDFFGPFYIEDKQSKIEKHYGLIFTCLVTRAVHLETCPDLNTDTFLNEYRRFTCRRCQPILLYSDNRKTFVGASEELKKSVKALDKDKIYKALAAVKTTWKFNPPYGPHFGGVWERLIQSAKRTLLIILGSKRLSFDIFETIMVEVEAILNSRPLTNVADQPENEEPLTPNHFLIQRPYSSLPPGNFGDQQPASFKNWKHVQQLMNHVWRRLIKEYLPTLLKRRKWTDNNQPPLKLGDVVWVLKDLTPRGIWPLGRVVETSPGRDGEVRVAKVKTAYGSFVRPVAGLARVFSP